MRPFDDLPSDEMIPLKRWAIDALSVYSGTWANDNFAMGARLPSDSECAQPDGNVPGFRNNGDKRIPRNFVRRVVPPQESWRRKKGF